VEKSSEKKVKKRTCYICVTPHLWIKVEYLC
jgi:hypothetical protein